ncbi:hypothetical protein DFJ74DRAFT_645466 [Hyaloraphidium curvatum]|nr:hypothetical protein DFJ74DRAFT_645466 [Hyaloraphidium curvatum]
MAVAVAEEDVQIPPNAGPLLDVSGAASAASDESHVNDLTGSTPDRPVRGKQTRRSERRKGRGLATHAGPASLDLTGDSNAASSSGPAVEEDLPLATRRSRQPAARIRIRPPAASAASSALPQHAGGPEAGAAAAQLPPPAPGSRRQEPAGQVVVDLDSDVEEQGGGLPEPGHRSASVGQRQDLSRRQQVRPQIGTVDLTAIESDEESDGGTGGGQGPNTMMQDTRNATLDRIASTFTSILSNVLGGNRRAASVLPGTNVGNGGNQVVVIDDNEDDEIEITSIRIAQPRSRPAARLPPVAAPAPARTASVPPPRVSENLLAQIQALAAEEKAANRVELRCAICLSLPSEGTQLSSTVCGHIFCEDCIKGALTAKGAAGKKCPVCRKSIAAKNAVHRLYL